MNVNPNELSSASQNNLIKQFLEEGNAISGMLALEKFGCWALPQRIFDLKESGFPIESQWIQLENGKRVKEYFMGEANEQQ
tara:strand:- start:344 stop:586 length:243 start_codon:yes stop_codon:yes gene_type:complete